nr:mRNA-decapping enzyme-like protein [Ipomoea batatas]
MSFSQTAKLMPNLDERSTKVLNLTVLQRIDPFIEEILITAAHVTFYEFNVDLNQWSRKDVEGSLFVVKRSSSLKIEKWEWIILVPLGQLALCPPPITAKIDAPGWSKTEGANVFELIPRKLAFGSFKFNTRDQHVAISQRIAYSDEAKQAGPLCLQKWGTYIVALWRMDNQIQLFWWHYFRNAQPRFQFVVMNRRNTENLVEDLLGDFEFEIQVPYLLYRNAAQEVNGIWFYNSRECQEVGNLFTRILSAYSKVSPKPKLSSNKSEYEELEAVPTCAVIEGPLEPSFTVPAHTDVAEDSSFLNFFDAATSIGSNPSKPLNTGQPYYASAPNIAPTSRVPGPIPSPTSNLQVPTAPQSAPSIPSLSLHEGTDPTTIKTNQVANLVKPSTFFTPPLSPVLPINPVASSISTPALHPPLNIQRPHGTPMLQPFPPPTPPPSLTSNPSPINVPLSREKVRDALLVLVQDNQFIDLVYQALLKVHQS